MIIRGSQSIPKKSLNGEVSKKKIENTSDYEVSAKPDQNYLLRKLFDDRPGCRLWVWEKDYHVVWSELLWARWWFTV